jgi:predicted phage terminase large subunit-like protein
MDALILSRVEPHALERLGYAQEMRNSLPKFMRWAWPIDPSHSRPLNWNWHLDVICDHLAACRAGDIRRLIINVPPRTLKSWTVSVAFPAWVWATDPSVQFLVTSADKDVVMRDADMQRDLCRSPQYQDTFRPKWNFRGGIDNSQQAAKGYYRNSFGGHRISKPMGTKGTGHNADYVIFDDPLDPADAFSDKAALAQHSINAKQRFMTRLNDADLGVVILIMQRLHEIDLAGVFLADGGWEHVYLPAEYEGRKVYSVLGDYDPRTEPGELLFPKRLHQPFLDEKKVELGSRGYAGQFQQNPAPAAGAIILKKWIEYWSDLPDLSYTIGSWDCTFGSKTSDADFVVGQTWGVDADGKCYLLDQCRLKMTVPEMIEAIKEQYRIWPGMRAVVVEKKAAGKEVIKTLETEIWGLDPYDPKDQSKEQRLQATAPMWEQRRIHLPHPLEAKGLEGTNYGWVSEDYLPELLMFPGSRHDDQVDATSQALIWIRDNGPGDVHMVALG